MDGVGKKNLNKNKSMNMKLISFKDKFPKKMSKILLYNANRNLEYDTDYFGDSPIEEHNTYLYLVKKFTHWMYCDDLPMP
jgi:hypothetical protein